MVNGTPGKWGITKEVTLIKEWSGAVIFNTILNTSNKRIVLKNMLDIFNRLIAQMTPDRNIYPSSRKKITSRKDFSNN